MRSFVLKIHLLLMINRKKIFFLNGVSADVNHAVNEREKSTSRHALHFWWWRVFPLIRKMFSLPLTHFLCY